MKAEKKYGSSWLLVLIALFFVVVYLIANCRWTNLLADDFYFVQVTELYGSIWNWLKYHYINWSGRLIQLPYVWLLQWGVWPFRILNVLFMTAQFYLFWRLSGSILHKNSEKAILLGFCGLQIINIDSLFSTVFWPTALVLYCWGMACALLAIWTLQQALEEKQLPWYRWVIACLAAIYAAYYEQSAATLMGFCVVYLAAFLISRKRIPLPVWILTALTAINTAVCLLAPGNSARSLTETIQRWPDFGAYGLFRKLALGISYSLEALTGNLLRYMLFAAALLFLLNLLHRRWLPLALSALPAGYYGLAVLCEWVPALRQWFPLYTYLPGDELFAGTPQMMFNTWLGVAAFMLLALLLFLSVPDNVDFLSGFLMLAAFANLMIMCASPTIYVSGTRCHYVSNLLLNLVSVWLLGKCLETGEMRSWKGAAAGCIVAVYGVMVAYRTLFPSI